jgi:Tol biopolymer transport system component
MASFPIRRNRILLAAALLLSIVLVATAARPTIEGWWRRTHPLSPEGHILVPMVSGLTVYDLAEGRQTVLVPVTPPDIVSAAAWSPDYTQIAYSLLHQRPGDSSSAMEIYLVDADGAAPRLLAERDQPGSVLDNPVWSRDGRTVYFSYAGQPGGTFVERIERVDVATGERTTLVENAYAPALSPDGRSLLFARFELAGLGLWLLPLEGGPLTPLLRSDRWFYVGVPRFSPDGTRVAVPIVGGAVSERTTDGFWGWLLPPIAYAHGEPEDIWTIDLQEKALRRLLPFGLDEPTLAWSPDGRYMALWSGNGLHLVDVAAGQTQHLLERGGYGTIAWSP